MSLYAYGLATLKIWQSWLYCRVQGPEAGSLNKSSCLAPALGVTKFIIVKDLILVTLCGAT
jgi:hypothetical protein